MSQLKSIYDSLVATGDLPPHYCGDWKIDKNQFTLEYSRNNHMFLDEDDLSELDYAY
jgi:hypothetical protein